MTETENSYFAIGFGATCLVIYGIYRLLKFLQSKFNLQPSQELPYQRVTEVVVHKKVTICRLPPIIFGANAYLYSYVGNLDRGISHVFARHPGDFSTSRKSNANHVVKHLRKNLTALNYIGEEADPQSRGGRYLWKTKDRNGIPKQLVTILSNRGKSYELITAYKR